MKNNKIKIFFVFILFIVIFSLIQFSSQNLAGADAYYNIKYAYLLRTEGLNILESFPWIQSSIWNKYPADLHFFYHILLIPFTFGNLIIGSKLSAILFSSLVFTSFYWILKKFKINYAFLWTILLFSSSSAFIFRMALPRAFVLSVFFSILGFYLIANKKYLWLFILAIIFALTHSTWPFLFLFCFIFLTINYLKTKKIDYKLLSLLIIGILLGLIFRPDFPQNLYLFFVQSFYIFYYKIIGINIGLGIEMSPITDFAAFASSNLIVLILFFGGFISCVINIINDIIPNRLRAIKNAVLENDKKIILYSLFLISVFFFILTIKANRFVEYWVPFTVLFGAFGINSLIKKTSHNFYFVNRKIKLLSSDKKALGGVFIKFFTGITLFGLIIANISYASFGIKSGMEYDKYKSAAEWLNENTPQGSIIFHTSWGDFPQLFFYNHRNYYIIGMDPTFMYAADPEKYWLWRHITEEGIICLTQKCKPPLSLPLRNGEKRDKLISEIIKKEFKAEYILISDIQEYEQFKKVLEKENGVKKVFSKNKMEIWKLE